MNDPNGALFLIGVLVSINVAISGWALNSIVKLRESVATDHARLTDHLEDHE